MVKNMTNSFAQVLNDSFHQLFEHRLVKSNKATLFCLTLVFKNISHNSNKLYRLNGKSICCCWICIVYYWKINVGVMQSQLNLFKGKG